MEVVQIILRADARALPLGDACVDAIVCDPPYELGFMGRSWDRSGVAYDPVTWDEAYRVLKPGAHLVAFGGSRTWHRMAVAIEDAGFELRDSIAWLYSQGFPKSRNVANEVAKAGGDGTAWQGWGTALKPSFEPIVLARKPLVGTIAQNVISYGTGAINVDGCRTAAADSEYAKNCSGDRGHAGSRTEAEEGCTDITAGGGSMNDIGRWPTNVVLSHAPLLDDDGTVIGDACADGCVPGCAVAELDAQAGPLRSGANPTRRRADKFRATYSAFKGEAECTAVRGEDEGTASRFYPVFRYHAKATKQERPTVNGVVHPTVKPLGLMRWLVKLITPPDGLVLDQFSGSGTTIEAALLEGFRAVAVEGWERYLPLIQFRVNRARSTAQEVALFDLPQAAGW